MKQRFDLGYSEMLIAAFLEPAKAHVKQDIDMIKVSVTKVNNTNTQKAHLSYQFDTLCRFKKRSKFDSKFVCFLLGSQALPDCKNINSYTHHKNVQKSKTCFKNRLGGCKVCLCCTISNF